MGRTWRETDLIGPVVVPEQRRHDAARPRPRPPRHRRTGSAHPTVLPFVPGTTEGDATSGAARLRSVLRVRGRARHRAAVPRTVLVALAGALVGIGVSVVAGRALVDDAYITLAYARTLGLHGDWGMYPGLTANTATSPLNVLLLGGATAVVRDALVASGVVLAVTFAAAAAWLARIGMWLQLPIARAPAFGLAFLATSPLLLSTVGLESALALALMLGLTERLLARAPWSAGVLAGLLVLTRPDLGVVALVAVLAAGRGWWRVAVAATVTTLPWFAWSWSVLGSAVPDTLLVKSGVRWGPWDYATGAGLWWAKFPTAVALIAVPSLAGLAALPLWLRLRDLRPAGAVLGVGALAHAVAMSLLDVAPFHWYYAPAAGGLGLLAALSCARAQRQPLRAVAVVGAAAVVAVSVTTAATAPMPPLTSNWATAAQYERIAARLPEGAVIEGPGEIGTLAYYCRCRVLDGLADRGSLTPLIESRLARATGPTGWLLRLDYRRFRPSDPVPRELRMTTQVVRGGPAEMSTRWGPPRDWALVPVAPPR